MHVGCVHVAYICTFACVRRSTAACCDMSNEQHAMTITLARHRFLAKKKPKSARTSGSEPRRFNLSQTPYYSLLAMRPYALTTHACS